MTSKATKNAQPGFVRFVDRILYSAGVATVEKLGRTCCDFLGTFVAVISAVSFGPSY